MSYNLPTWVMMLLWGIALCRIQCATIENPIPTIFSYIKVIMPMLNQNGCFNFYFIVGAFSQRVVNAISNLQELSVWIPQDQILSGLLITLTLVFTFIHWFGGLLQVTMCTLMSWTHLHNFGVMLFIWPATWFGGKEVVSKLWLSLWTEYLTQLIFVVFPPYLLKNLFFDRFHQIKIGVACRRSLIIDSPPLSDQLL